MGNNLGTHHLNQNDKEFILKHPSDCQYKGATDNRRETYHGYWVIEDQLELCGLKPSTALFKQIQAIQKEHEETKCGFTKRSLTHGQM